MHIECVCLGNICRSPAAEAVLRRKFAEAGLDEVTVTSAGTGDWHVGQAPYHLSSQEGERRGYTFETVARQITPGDFAGADLVLAMDEQNAEDLRALAPTPQDAAKVVALGAFAPGADAADPEPVPDPYGQDAAAFTAMYDQIEPACESLVAAVQDGSWRQVVERAAR